MKRCPTCNQTYEDDALSFCPNDGTPLTGSAPSSYTPQATIMAPPPSVTQNPPDPFGAPSQSEWGATPGAWTPPPSPAPGMGYTGTQGRQQGLAIASMVCGIMSIICCLGLLTGIPALVLGYVAMNKEKEDPAHYGGRGLAVAGLITGGIGTIFGTLGLVLQILPIIFR